MTLPVVGVLLVGIVVVAWLVDRESTQRVLRTLMLGGAVFLVLVGVGGTIAVTMGNPWAMGVLQAGQSAVTGTMVRAGLMSAPHVGGRVNPKAMMAAGAAAAEVLAEVPEGVWTSSHGRMRLGDAITIDPGRVPPDAVSPASRLGGLAPGDLQALDAAAAEAGAGNGQVLVDPDAMKRLLDATERIKPGSSVRVALAVSELPEEAGMVALPQGTLVPRSTVERARGTVSAEAFDGLLKRDLGRMGRGLSIDVGALSSSGDGAGFPDVEGAADAGSLDGLDGALPEAEDGLPGTADGAVAPEGSGFAIGGEVGATSGSASDAGTADTDRIKRIGSATEVRFVPDPEAVQVPIEAIQDATAQPARSGTEDRAGVRNGSLAPISFGKEPSRR